MAKRVLQTAQILWPAFVVAGLLEMVVFSWVDPVDFRLGSWQPGTMTAYSVSFLVFWGLVSLASTMSHWLMAAAQAADQGTPPLPKHHA